MKERSGDNEELAKNSRGRNVNFSFDFLYTKIYVINLCKLLVKYLLNTFYGRMHVIAR